ncbi:MAG: cell division protein ZapA [Gammaproteobacteria bacterium]|nr:cell division protein ZapA [Gammaproteobacteria bacterium]
MNDITIPVVVRILDKDYRIACQRGEEDSLRASALYLDQKMREIKTGGKVIGSDRIAVMAALNIAHELLEHKGLEDLGAQAISKRLQQMQEKIDIALNQGN